MVSLDRNRNILQNILVAILLTSLGIHALSLLLNRTFFLGWQWVQVPFHSWIETVGAVIAFVVAVLLMALEKRGEGTSYNLRIAGALVAMGLMDGFHAMVSVGHIFVFYHSMAMFVGGVLFALVWMPAGVFERFHPSWPYWTALGVALLGCLVVWFPDRVPSMLNSSGFTFTAQVLNVCGGLLLLAASIRLMMTFRQNEQIDDLLFSLHCLLFGAAGIMFEQSMLWDFAWWGWHFLRLLAYGAALVFAAHTFYRDQIALQERKETLEKRVSKRTDELKHALREKKTLLKEIHHRVKNNMQVISSMLSLQSNQFQDSAIREQFNESLSRINSMAMVHDLLYQSEDMDRLDFGNYVQRLLDELSTTLNTDESDITIRTDIQEIYLSIGTAVRCGLIVNELVTNSLQHAFKDGESGTVALTFKEDDGRYELNVRDDGSGFNKGEVYDSSNALGMELVESLVKTDLDGEIDVENDGGARVRITFEQPDIGTDL